LHFPAQIAFLFALVWGSLLRAEDFRLSLELSQASHRQATTNPADPHEVKPVTKRPTITVEADSKVTAAWKVTYIAKAAMNDVLVHFYVVKIQRSGQAPPPLAPQRVLLESALNMDFATGTSTEAKLEARPKEAGVYLVRLEAQGAGETSAAEMELVVK
jgi:hypothetical protein